MKIKINRENQIVINDEVVAVTKINEKMEWEPSKKTRKNFLLRSGILNTFRQKLKKL